jgi:hypothetical protein
MDPLSVAMAARRFATRHLDHCAILRTPLNRDAISGNDEFPAHDSRRTMYVSELWSWVGGEGRLIFARGI